MSWADGRMCAFDCESTGVDVENDRIVTACVAWVGGGDEPVIRRWTVAVDIDIPQGATDVHGITTEQARAEGIPASAAVEGILAELEAAAAQGLPLVVYNAPFDFTLLDREARRWSGEGLTFVPRPVVDPLCIDKTLDRYRKGKRTLTATCQQYKVVLDEAHAAHGDAMAAARLAWRLAKVYPADLADLEQLHDKQVGWYAESSRSFAEYLRKCAGRSSDPAEREQLLVRADGVGSSWPLTVWPAAEAVAS